jgi:3-oxoacyl-[acyl-carrier protein] reductase
MFRLTGKNALITGATGGIGVSISKALVGQGARLVLSATREEKLQELAKEIDSGTKHDTKHDIKYIACDLSDNMAINALFDEAENLVGQIDILVCNAGITKDNLALRMKDEDFSEVVDINLKSTFILNRNAIKKMVRRKYGRIINISSVVGITGNSGQCNYAASKGGIIAMSKSLAFEVANRGITVNCVAPGFIQSPMTDILNDRQREAMLSRIPLGKMGDVSDIAAGVIFLASQNSGYITGHTLNINGGMFMS